MSNTLENETLRALLELKSVQLELFTLTHRNLHAALGAWQDQVRFLDPRLQDPRVVTCAHGQVYSQNNEDGIISEIFRRIGTKNRSFVEFGVGDGQKTIPDFSWSLDGQAAGLREMRSQQQLYVISFESN